jgi:hypothetical protein
VFNIGIVHFCANSTKVTKDSSIDNTIATFQAFAPEVLSGTGLSTRNMGKRDKFLTILWATPLHLVLFSDSERQARSYPSALTGLYLTAQMQAALRTSNKLGRAAHAIAKRNMSGAVSIEEEVKEMNKWR